MSAYRILALALLATPLLALFVAAVRHDRGWLLAVKPIAIATAAAVALFAAAALLMRMWS